MNFEVYHHPLKDDNDKTDLWVFDDLGTGKSLTNQAYHACPPRQQTAHRRREQVSLHLCAEQHGSLRGVLNRTGRRAQRVHLQRVSQAEKHPHGRARDVRGRPHAIASRARPSGARRVEPLLLLIDEMPSFLSGLEHGIATGVVDDKYFFLSPPENVVIPSGFMDRWKVTSADTATQPHSFVA